MKRAIRHSKFLPFALLLFAAVSAHARVGLLIEEPFGSFGTMMPVGHASVFFDRLCAATPASLRPCEVGEEGVVISRLHDMRQSNLDWLAVPVVPFLYGVDDPAGVPSFVTPPMINDLRERYREQHLRSAIPDRPGREETLLPARYGDWDESVGATFDRRVFLYVFDTTPEQDAAILRKLNGAPNVREYKLGRANCADFAADVFSIAFPGVVHRARLADFDMMTPKQLARLVDAYGHAHPELHFQAFEIPQLPGTTRRSRPVRGAAETFVHTKRYAAVIGVLQPELLLADWIIYEDKGRWTPGRDTIRLTPAAWLQQSETSHDTDSGIDSGEQDEAAEIALER